jgi:hypothetical protein
MTHKPPCERLWMMVTDYLTLTTSRWQGQNREGLSGGSLSAKRRADGQEHHKKACFPGTSWHKTTKSCGSGDKVNDAVVS